MTGSIAPDAQPSDAVRGLAGAIQASLRPDVPLPALNSGLVNLADGRHRVAGILAAAAERAAIGDCRDLLLRQRADYAKSFARNMFGQLRIRSILSQSRLAYSVMKGAPLAEALYPEPQMRHSGDIDILVRPADFVTAFTGFATNGWKAVNPPLRPTAELIRHLIPLLRDVTLLDPVSGAKLELHQRMFFSRRLAKQVMALHPDHLPRLPAGPHDVPAPAIGAGLAHYLLCHGAVSGWVRLKWLADIHQLMSKLSDADNAEIIAAAETCGTAASLKASLILYSRVFEQPLADPLQNWAAEQSGRAPVARRLRSYTAGLNETSGTAASPLNDRRASILSLLRLSQDTGSRIEVAFAGPAASALRFAMSQFGKG